MVCSGPTFRAKTTVMIHRQLPTMDLLWAEAERLLRERFGARFLIICLGFWMATPAVHRNYPTTARAWQAR
jgi:hypothetical protein